MADKQTIVDIKTRYDGSGAAQAKTDVDRLNSAGVQGLAGNAQAMDAAKRKTDELSRASNDLNKSKVALNAVTLTLRGSFREAGQQLEKLGGAWKTTAALLATSVATIGAVIAVTATLIAKWKEHKQALKEADDQVKALQWDRVQEMLDLKFEKGKKALSEWVESLQKVETQARASADALMILQAAKEDAEMAYIDKRQADGTWTPDEAQSQRNQLLRSRELGKVEKEKQDAQSAIERDQGIVYKTSGDVGRIEKQASGDQAALEKQIEELKAAGVIDERGAEDLRLIARQGGDEGAPQQERLRAVVADLAKARAEKEARALSREGDVDFALQGGVSESAYPELLKKYEAEASDKLSGAIFTARKSGVSSREAEALPALKAQNEQAKNNLLRNRAILEAAPIKEQNINDRFAIAEQAIHEKQPSYVAAQAKGNMAMGLEFPGRRDNAGLHVPGSGAQQQSQALQLIDQAQAAIVQGGDSEAIGTRLAQLLQSIGVIIKQDRATFMSLADQLDGLVSEMKDLKSRVNNNTAGD